MTRKCNFFLKYVVSGLTTILIGQRVSETDEGSILIGWRWSGPVGCSILIGWRWSVPVGCSTLPGRLVVDVEDGALSKVKGAKAGCKILATLKQKNLKQIFKKCLKFKKKIKKALKMPVSRRE